MVKKKKVIKSKAVKTFTPESIIIDILNGLLIYYSKAKFKGDARVVRVKGEKALYKKGIMLGIDKRIEVYDRFSRTNLNFRKLLR